MKKILISTENSKTNWQHKNATKHLDHTTIADRLRTVSWSNNNSSNWCGKTGLWIHNLPIKRKSRVWKGHVCSFQLSVLFWKGHNHIQCIRSCAYIYPDRLTICHLLNHPNFCRMQVPLWRLFLHKRMPTVWSCYAGMTIFLKKKIRVTTIKRQKRNRKAPKC